MIIDVDEKICDSCDEIKKYASIKDLSGNVIVVYKDRLIEILEQF